MAKISLKESASPFLDYLENLIINLPELNLDEISRPPERVAIVSIDVINGFCTEGPLASPRVAKIVSPIKHLLQSAWERGIQNIVLIQDTHAPDAVEFGQYAPHCIRGTTESQTVPEIQSLPFFDQLTIIPKNSISPMFRTAFPDWVKSHPDVDTFITVGDCTDICTYQLAIDLRAEANAWQMRRRVILPIDCTDTYDLSKDTADSVGALPHPADLLHSVFLYHMALNGIELVKRIRS